MIKHPYDLTQEERAEHEQRWGGYNDFPPGWRRITEKEYAQQAHTFTPILVEYRQMFKREDSYSTMVAAHLSFQPDNQTGFATVAKFWEGKMQYFKFGCTHKQHGMNHFKCPSCGWCPHYDTSD